LAVVFLAAVFFAAGLRVAVRLAVFFAGCFFVRVAMIGLRVPKVNRAVYWVGSVN